MKKIIAVVMAAAMLAGVLSIAASAQSIRHDDTYMLGDANSDKAVNAKDSLYLKGYIAMLEDFDVNENAADLNADGKVNAKDSLVIKTILSKNANIEDYENGKSIYSLTIGGIDASEFCVVVPADATKNDNVYYAAKEFVKYINEIYGTSLDFCLGEANATSEHMVVFHGLYGSDDPLADTLGTDGYLYEVTDGNLNIYGALRGNMYAVYDILEEYAGYRFYSTGETFIFKTRCADIAEGTSYQYIPLNTFRYSDQTFGKSSLTTYYLPSKMNGTQLYSGDDWVYGRQTGPHFINAHSFLYYYTMDMGYYLSDSDDLHERYTVGENAIEESNKTASKKITGSTWQPCATDDAVYQKLFHGLLLTMDMIQEWGHSFVDGLASMSFSINDNEYYCNCRFCSSKRKTEGNSGLYVDLSNKAARDIKDYYPNMKIFTIIYNHDIPQTVRPESNLIIMYCGTGCNQHVFGSGECGDNVTTHGTSNKLDDVALKAWGQYCKDAGTEMWFWYYPVTYAYYLVGCPNIFNIYYDYEYLFNECNVTGIYYEGSDKDYLFEALKAYMSAKLMWDTDMTYDEYIDTMKEYLYIYYGDGYEDIYQYLLLQEEAGNECGCCFVNNWDRPGDMYSYTYIAAHYEEMRALLVSALEKAGLPEQQERLKTLIISCDFLGMSASYDTMYTKGTAASRATYEERFDNMYNRIKSTGMEIFCNDQYTLPDTIDYSVNPMIQFYEYGSRRIDPNCPWGVNPS